MHLKRQEVPKNWPIPRKGGVYVVRPSSKADEGLPILIILRDLLKVAQNRKEVKRAINLKQVLINLSPVRNDNQNTSLFDVIIIVPSKKNYRIDLTENGKFTAKEISEKESIKKISKVMKKTTLKKGKTQINLSDGNNFISDVKCDTNDSALINLKDKKIEKIIELKDKANAIVTKGKHTGKKGIINNIDSKNRMAQVKTPNGEINVLIKQLMVIEND